MALTFQDVVNYLVTTVQRDDLLPRYLGFVNDAVHKIAEMHSFEQMKATGTGSVAIGQTRASLPADFKELQDGRYPIFDTVGSNPGVLVPVFSRAEVEKLLGAGLVPPLSFIYTQDYTGGTPNFYVDLPAPATALHTLNQIYYFAYPSAVTDPTQTTPLITYFFNLVRLKAASIAFESINDPVYQLHENQFTKEFAVETGMDLAVAMARMTQQKT